MHLALIYTKDPDHIAAIKVLATAAFFGVPLLSFPIQWNSIEDRSISSPLCRCPVSGAVLYLQIREKDKDLQDEMFLSAEERQPCFVPPVFGVNAILRLIYRLSLQPREVDPRSAIHSPFVLTSEEMWMDMTTSQIEQPHAEAIESLFPPWQSRREAEEASVREKRVEGGGGGVADEKEGEGNGKENETRLQGFTDTRITPTNLLVRSTRIAPPESLTKVLEQLEDRLRVQTFLAGERLSLSDISVAFAVHWMYRCFEWERESENGLPVVGGSHCVGYPSVHRHYRTVLHQPSIEKILVEEELRVW